MKKLFIILVFVLSAGSLYAVDKDTLSSLWDQANTKYVNGDYSGAIVLYDSIVGQGYSGSKVYYNLGNAYFKNDAIGKAIVNYNRALKLAPYDKDIQYNLAIANSYIKDRIVTVPDFFLSNWTRGLRTTLSSNAWAILSLVFLTITLACFLVYMLGEKKSVRKGGFFAGIIFALVCAMSVSFSVVERKDILNASEAIVISSAASVKSSPDRNSQDLFIIHEGTKLDVQNSYNGWNEVLLADGNKGWILSEAIELTDLK